MEGGGGKNHSLGVVTLIMDHAPSGDDRSRSAAPIASLLSAAEQRPKAAPDTTQRPACVAAPGEGVSSPSARSQLRQRGRGTYPALLGLHRASPGLRGRAAAARSWLRGGGSASTAGPGPGPAGPGLRQRWLQSTASLHSSCPVEALGRQKKKTNKKPQKQQSPNMLHLLA